MAPYLKLYRSGKLRERVDAAVSLLESCSVCPRSRGVNRLAGNVGKCRTSCEAMVSGHGPHFGEETPLVGKHGSGTIFFTNCNLRCLFCQNYSISQLGEGQRVSKEGLAYIMLSLQAKGCHNIISIPNPRSFSNSGSTGASNGVRLTFPSAIQQGWL